MLLMIEITNFLSFFEDLMISQTLNNYIHEVELNFATISPAREKILDSIYEYIRSKRLGEEVKLTFICTHNSRRSHISQIWAQVAAFYYGIKNIQTYSGGTEATSFNPRAVKAMEKTGLKITISENSSNPVYLVEYSENASPITSFSKTYNDQFNPQSGYCAIMTCSDADEACPIVFDCEKRVALTYEDPKKYDDTPLEEEKYDERCFQIATEIFYLFSRLKANTL